MVIVGFLRVGREAPVALVEIVLILLAAVLISTVLDPIFPRVSLPLVQVALGVALAIAMPRFSTVSIGSDIFLVVLVAPLLFDDSRHLDMRTFLENGRSILSLALGLVLVSVLVIAFTLHLIVPSVPLAVAFTLAAALSPTDPVAVVSLSKRVSLTQRQQTTLAGEALVNDASGVVSFQFALAAAVTGTFSLLEASESFLLNFIGGVALGLAIGFVVRCALRFLRTRGYEDATAHVVVEIFTPFIVFLTAEHIGVSGILAVMSAGFLLKLAPIRFNPLTNRIALTSSHVWEVLSYVANGIVFTLLGTQLPRALAPATTTETRMDFWLLMGCILVVTALLMCLRFAWIFAMRQLERDPKTGRRGRRIGEALLRDVGAMTLAGPKGALTLSIVFTIPFAMRNGAPFPYREDVICIASGVIVCTLLLANFLMPVVSPRKAEASSEREKRRAKIEIMQNVIKELRAQSTPETARATHVVVRSCAERIRQLRADVVSDEQMRKMTNEVVSHQIAFVWRAVDDGLISAETGHIYTKRLTKTGKVLPRYRDVVPLRRNNDLSLALVLGRLLHRVGGAHRSNKRDEQRKHTLLTFARLERSTIDFLRERSASADAGTAACAKVLLAEHESSLASAEMRLANDYGITNAVPPSTQPDQTGTLATTMFKPAVGNTDRLDPDVVRAIKNQMPELDALALQLELEQIQQMYADGRISRALARELRHDVYLLQMGMSESA